MRKLSATMAVGLAEGLEHGGALVRWQGGFWTFPGCAVKADAERYRVPAWYLTWGTVKALIARGHAEVRDIGSSGEVVGVRLIADPDKN